MLDISSLIPQFLPHYKNLIPNHVFFFSSLIFVMAIVCKIPVLSKKMESLPLVPQEKLEINLYPPKDPPLIRCKIDYFLSYP